MQPVPPSAETLPVNSSVVTTNGDNQGDCNGLAGTMSWLNEFASNVTSQSGEDGIIEKALDLIGEHDRHCVEFGAWDGQHLSNTYNLIKNKGYSGVLIEANSDKFRELQEEYAENNKVISLNQFVGCEEDDNLDHILSEASIPTNFDVLSIDIDGNDYHVFDAMKRYKPKILVIEFNHTIPSHIEFVQPKDPSVAQGASLLSLTKLGKSKGYELVATTRTNLILVDAKYFPRFEIDDNSPEALRRETSHVSYIFCGFDGTIFVAGNPVMNWHGTPYASRIRQLPGWMRGFPPNYNYLQRQGLRYINGATKGKGVRMLLWHFSNDVAFLRRLKKTRLVRLLRGQYGGTG